MTWSPDKPPKSSRSGVSIEEVSSAFRDLAEDHAASRELDARKLTWNRLRFSSNEDTRARLLSSPKLRFLAPVAAAICAAAAVFFVLFRAPLEYELVGATAQGQLIRTQDKTAALEFSDGSRIDVGAASALSIELLGPNAARAHLVQGTLGVQVRHEAATDYRFLAGPYEVRVIGTRFRLAWEPREELLTLDMYEGRVRVLGPNQLDRVLSSGESLRFSGTGKDRSARVALEKAKASPDGAALPETRDVDVPRVNAASTAVPAKGAVAAGEPDWAALVSKGRFAEVVQAAKAIGADRALSERSERDLNALAHSAHYTGHSALSLAAWRSLRERFAQRSIGRQAAFFLGRVHDQEGRPTEALRWLNAYLGEAPGDVYASEALGRKINLVYKLEGQASAQKVAREYLTRFPKGTYARAARAIINGP